MGDEGSAVMFGGAAPGARRVESEAHHAEGPARRIEASRTHSLSYAPGAAALTSRNLDSEGGFVAGAPESRQADGTNSGSVKVLLNTAGSSYSWSSWSTDIDEETEGDHRPTN